MTLIDLDPRFNPRLFSYESAPGHKRVVLQGISPEIHGEVQVVIDSAASRSQTVVLAIGLEWEIVLELHPRRLSELERTRIIKGK